MAKTNKKKAPPTPPVSTLIVGDPSGRPVCVRLWGPALVVDIALPPGCSAGDAQLHREQWLEDARQFLRVSPYQGPEPEDVLPTLRATDATVTQATHTIYESLFPAGTALSVDSPWIRTVWRLCSLIAAERKASWQAWERLAAVGEVASAARRDAKEDRAAAESHIAAWQTHVDELGAFLHVARALVARLPGSEAAVRVLALAQDLCPPGPLAFPSDARLRRLIPLMGVLGLGIGSAAASLYAQIAGK